MQRMKRVTLLIIACYDYCLAAANLLLAANRKINAQDLGGIAP